MIVGSRLFQINQFDTNGAKGCRPYRETGYLLASTLPLLRRFPQNLSGLTYKYRVCCFVFIILASICVDSSAESKIALVIGNGKYQHAENLPIPANDARAISKQLQQLGFTTIEGIDVTKGEMKSLLRRFSKKLTTDTIALFYYAGHGIQREGKNYLIPVNADIKKAYELEDAGLDLNTVLQAFNQYLPKLSIALIDACRDNPFEKHYTAASRGYQQKSIGLADLRDSAGGTILSYATEPGKTAVDGYGEHSPYTSALLKYIKVPGLSVHDMLNEVGLEVLRSTNKDQKPWLASSPVSRFCFSGCDLPASTLKISTNTPVSQSVALKQAIQTADFESLRKLVVLSKKQHDFMQRLFATYPSMSVSVTNENSTRSTHTNRNSRDQKVSIVIKEAKNHKGNRVIPTDAWRSLSFSYRN